MKKINCGHIELETLRYHLVIFIFFLGGGGGGGGISLQSIFYCKSGPFVIQNRYAFFELNNWPSGFLENYVLIY